MTASPISLEKEKIIISFTYKSRDRNLNSLADDLKDNSRAAQKPNKTNFANFDALMIGITKSKIKNLFCSFPLIKTT